MTNPLQLPLNLCMCVSGWSVLPSGCVQWCLSGWCQGLGLRWGDVARSGSLWPVAVNDPGEAFHWPVAGRHHRQDPSAARHHRDPLHCAQHVH